MGMPSSRRCWFRVRSRKPSRPLDIHLRLADSPSLPLFSLRLRTDSSESSSSTSTSATSDGRACSPETPLDLSLSSKQTEPKTRTGKGMGWDHRMAVLTSIKRTLRGIRKSEGKASKVNPFFQAASPKDSSTTPQSRAALRPPSPSHAPHPPKPPLRFPSLRAPSARRRRSSRP